MESTPRAFAASLAAVWSRSQPVIRVKSAADANHSSVSSSRGMVHDVTASRGMAAIVSRYLRLPASSSPAQIRGPDESAPALSLNNSSVVSIGRLRCASRTPMSAMAFSTRSRPSVSKSWSVAVLSDSLIISAANV
jgi:hypothetical protein